MSEPAQPFDNIAEADQKQAMLRDWVAEARLVPLAYRHDDDGTPHIATFINPETVHDYHVDHHIQDLETILDSLSDQED